MSVPVRGHLVHGPDFLTDALLEEVTVGVPEQAVRLQLEAWAVT